MVWFTCPQATICLHWVFSDLSLCKRKRDNYKRLQELCVIIFNCTAACSLCLLLLQWLLQQYISNEIFASKPKNVPPNISQLRWWRHGTKLCNLCPAHTHLISYWLFLHWLVAGPNLHKLQVTDKKTKPSSNSRLLMSLRKMPYEVSVDQSDQWWTSGGNVREIVTIPRYPRSHCITSTSQLRSPLWTDLHSRSS